MKLKLAIGIASAAMLFSACGDDSVTNINDEAKEKGMVTLKVVDNNTGVAIDSAEVYSLIDAETLYSDSLGTVTWTKNQIGDYEYTVSKEGYATRLARVTLQENSGGDMARVEDRIHVVNMYKKGVSVKGTVLLKNPQTGNLTAASKVKVVLSYENDFIVPSEITTTTDTSGVYEFKNLAEGLTYSVMVPQVTVDGKTYASVVQKVDVDGDIYTIDGKKRVDDALRSGEQRVLDLLTMEIVGLNPELIKDNLQEVEAGDPLKLTFSTKLVADSVPSNWKVSKLNNAPVDYDDIYVDNGAVSVLVTAELDGDGKTVVVKPVSQKWTKLATYRVSGVVYTSEGKKAVVTKTFVPGSAVSKPEVVKELAATEYSVDFIQLSWKATDDEIKGYKVFYKASESADYEEFKKWSVSVNGSIVDSLPIDSASCKKSKSYEDCEIYEDLETRPNRTETNYWWYTKLEKQKVDADEYDSYDASYSYDYTFTWTTKRDSAECEASSYSSYTSVEECYDLYETYGDYDDYVTKVDEDGYTVYDPEHINYSMRIYKWRFTTDLAKAQSCVTSSRYYDDDDDCYAIAQALGTPPVQTTNYYKSVAKDSTSLTVKNGADLTLNEKYQENYTKYGAPNAASTTYNFWWYTEYASVRPNAKSTLAFVPVKNATTDVTKSVKFVVLPYVVVGGDTILADAIKANSAEFKIAEEKTEKAEEKK